MNHHCGPSSEQVLLCGSDRFAIEFHSFMIHVVRSAPLIHKERVPSRVRVSHIAISFDVCQILSVTAFASLFVYNLMCSGVSESRIHNVIISFLIEVAYSPCFVHSVFYTVQSTYERLGLALVPANSGALSVTGGQGWTVSAAFDVEY